MSMEHSIYEGNKVLIGFKEKNIIYLKFTFTSIDKIGIMIIFNLYY